jgi:hypothetical protein
MTARAPIVGSLVAFVVAAGVLVVGVARSGPDVTSAVKDTTEKQAPIATTTAATYPAAATTTVMGTAATTTTSVVATTNAPSPSALEEALHGTDPWATRDAIVAAVDAKDFSALPVLEKVDLSKDGFVSAATIQGVGKLGAIADAPAKHDAVQTLNRWLRDETKRGTPDAIGNASIAIDALHDASGTESADALVAALDSASEPLHLETRIVQALDAMHAQSAISAITRFEARVRMRTPSDDLETALITEAIAAAETALADLR